MNVNQKYIRYKAKDLDTQYSLILNEQGCLIKIIKFIDIYVN